jgi:hypothetical protein
MMQQINPSSKSKLWQLNICSIITTCDAQLQSCRSTVMKKGLDHFLILLGAHTEKIPQRSEEYADKRSEHLGGNPLCLMGVEL